MGNVITPESVLVGIANSIRNKTGRIASMAVKTIPNAINDIQINGASYVNVTISEYSGHCSVYASRYEIYAIKLLSSTKVNEILTIINNGNIPRVSLTTINDGNWQFDIVKSEYLTSKENVAGEYYSSGHLFWGVSVFNNNYNKTYGNLIVLTDGEFSYY